ncbi:MAG: hypothetical protein GSR80_001560 [Desulfurococcales archaeon]|nr:hypothetical protein [Desulfurococcales archaeon]
MKGEDLVKQESAGPQEALPEEVRGVIEKLKDMSEDELLKLAEEYREKIISIKDQRRTLVEENRKLRAQRRRLIEEKRQLTSRLQEVRRKRNELMEQLRQLKSERDKIREELEKKREQLQLARKLAEKEGDLAKLSLKRLQRRLEDLEWRQMTSVLPPEAEKRIVEEISRLEELIERVRKAKQQVLSIMELEAEVKALRLKNRDLTQRINEIRESIGEVKREIQSLVERIEEYNKKIDALSEEINERSAILDDLSRQLDLLYAVYREIMVKVRELKLARQYRMSLEELEKRRKEVMEKYKRGEPLSLQELRILYGEFDEIIGRSSRS